MKVTSDYHVHTKLSLCADPGAELRGYLAECGKKGIKTIGFSDHCWDTKIPGASDWYKTQTAERVLALRAQIPDDIRGLEALIGCETEFLGGPNVGMSAETAALFDYVLVPASHFHMSGFTVPAGLAAGGAAAIRELLYRRFNEAVLLDIADGIAHPFVPCGFTGDKLEDEILSGITDNLYGSSFRAAASRGVSVEIHAHAVNHWIEKEKGNRMSEYVRMMTVAAECGCAFHFGSDSHSVSDFADRDYGAFARFAEACGIKETMIKRPGFKRRVRNSR